MKKLADAMAKDANGPDARAYLEEYRNIPMDVKVHPTEAGEILDIYRQRIQGKYRGDLPQMVDQEMTSIQAAVKRSG